MEKEFVTFDQAVELKKLLYGEHYGDDYFAWYSSNKDFHYRNMNSPVYPNNQSFIAPLKQQVFRWFQNKYNWYHTMDFRRKAYPSTNQYKWKIDISLSDVFFMGWADTYEEAENACIDKLIELVNI